VRFVPNAVVTKLGLRTLEFWVDNLNPEYLYPHMQAVLDELMRSLCALLRPNPSPFGATALNVLGKLGGRNRRFLLEEFKLKPRAHAEEGLTLHFKFASNGAMFALPMDRYRCYLHLRRVLFAHSLHRCL
jgi:transformation/transcription domain-associated protein